MSTPDRRNRCHIAGKADYQSKLTAAADHMPMTAAILTNGIVANKRSIRPQDHVGSSAPRRPSHPLGRRVTGPGGVN
jgi:hypothetical protein